MNPVIPPWYRRVMPWVCLGLLAALAAFWALTMKLLRSFPLPMLIACCMLAAMFAVLTCGCVATRADVALPNGTAVHVQRVALFNRTELQAKGGEWQIGYNGAVDKEALLAAGQAIIKAAGGLAK